MSGKRNGKIGAWYPGGWKRLVQLRLATLLALVTVFSALLGFRQAYLAPYQRQAEAVDKLKAMGAQIEFERARPAWIGVLVGRDIYHDVFKVHLEHRGVTDEQLDVLHDLLHVRYLYLAGNPISDEGVRNLLPLKNVRRLSLWRTRITDQGLEYLSRNRQLAALDLHATGVSDDGLAHLVRLSELVELKLGSRITDAGLIHVGKLPELRQLNLLAAVGT